MVNTLSKLCKFFEPAYIEQVYGISVKTLANWRSQGKGPAYYKFGGKVRYKAEDIETWIEKSRIRTIDCNY